MEKTGYIFAGAITAAGGVIAGVVGMTNGLESGISYFAGVLLAAIVTAIFFFTSARAMSGTVPMMLPILGGFMLRVIVLILLFTVIHLLGGKMIPAAAGFLFTALVSMVAEAVIVAKCGKK